MTISEIQARGCEAKVREKERCSQAVRSLCPHHPAPWGSQAPLCRGDDLSRVRHGRQTCRVGKRLNSHSLHQYLAGCSGTQKTTVQLWLLKKKKFSIQKTSPGAR